MTTDLSGLENRYLLFAVSFNIKFWFICKPMHTFNLKKKWHGYSEMVADHLNKKSTNILTTNMAINSTKMILKEKWSQILIPLLLWREPRYMPIYTTYTYTTITPATPKIQCHHRNSPIQPRNFLKFHIPSKSNLI